MRFFECLGLEFSSVEENIPEEEIKNMRIERMRIENREWKEEEKIEKMINRERSQIYRYNDEKRYLVPSVD